MPGRRSLSFGLVLDSVAPGRHDPDPQMLRRTATAAGEAGFDSVWVDDVIGAGRLDPFQSVAMLAERVAPMEVGVVGLAANLRHPVQAAQDIASLDRLTQGRSIIAVTAGAARPAMFEAHRARGVSFDSRHARLSETVDLWRALWHPKEAPGEAARTVSVSGRQVSYAGPTLTIRPSSAHGPAVWLADSGSAHPRRVPPAYDGWVSHLPSPERYAAHKAEVECLHAKAGRRGAFRWAQLLTMNVSDSTASAWTALDRWTRQSHALTAEHFVLSSAAAWGSPSRLGATVAAFVEAGASDLIFRVGDLHPERQIEQLGEIIASFRAATASGLS